MIFTVSAEGFGFNSILIILNQSLIPFVLSMGIFLLIMTGMFDLSVGTQMYTVGIFACALAQRGMGASGLIIGCVVGGVLLGAVMGGIYSLLRIPSMILSLGMVFVWEWIQWLCFGQISSIYLDRTISEVGASPYSFIYAIVASLIFIVLYGYTAFGYRIRLVGNNEMTAKSVGVSAPRAKFMAFVWNGLFVGIAAVLQCCYSGSMSYMASMSSVSSVFRPIMAVMIAVGLALEPHDFAYKLEPPTILLPEGLHFPVPTVRSIKAFTAANYRYIFEDFFAKLAISYGK